MYSVYVIESIEYGRKYIGYTEDIQKRLNNHNSGGTKSTNKYRPYRVIYTEEYKSKKEAINREKEIKKMKGGITFKKLIQNNKHTSGRSSVG